MQNRLREKEREERRESGERKDTERDARGLDSGICVRSAARRGDRRGAGAEGGDGGGPTFVLRMSSSRCDPMRDLTLSHHGPGGVVKRILIVTMTTNNEG